MFDTMVLFVWIYAITLTITIISCAIYIIFIGVKRTRNIKRNVIYIENVVNNLSEKIGYINEKTNKELQKMNENIYLLKNTVNNILKVTEPYNITAFKPHEINNQEKLKHGG